MTVRVWRLIALFSVIVLIGWIGYVEVWNRIQLGVQANLYLTRCIQVGTCPPVDKLFPSPVPTEKKGN